MAQLIPLPLTVSCFSKIQIGFTFLVPAHPGSPGQRAVKRVCMCVYYCYNTTLCAILRPKSEMYIYRQENCDSAVQQLNADFDCSTN